MSGKYKREFISRVKYFHDSNINNHGKDFRRKALRELNIKEYI